MAQTSNFKVALVTGANSGIGKATATGLAKDGFHVTLVVRDADKGVQTVKEIQQKVPNAKVEILHADLSSQKSIRDAAQRWLKAHDRLDVLVNAAGVFLPTRTLTDEGVEATIATNYVAYFLLTDLLLPALKKAAPSRIVNVSSRYGGAKVDFDDPMFEKRKFAYMKVVPPTMVARVLFTQELAERLKGTGVVVNAVHPGLVKNTQLLNQTRGFFRWFVNRVGATPEKGADTVLWLATAPETQTETGKMWTSRKQLKTPGQGSDPEARKRLWNETEKWTSSKAVKSNGGPTTAKRPATKKA
jgi:NAD(P)-dependent dehydrogenase (short-subunit alcohol dehydrogenase family)